jgi:hypothetical protein
LGFLLCFQVSPVKGAAVYFIKILALAKVLQGRRNGDDERRYDAEYKKQHANGNAKAHYALKVAGRLPYFAHDIIE